MSEPDLLTRRNRVFGAGSPLFYRQPIELVRGRGVEVFDADGRRYIDMYNNVPCVGHANPRVVEAIRAAQSTLNVHSRYLHEDIVQLGERLVSRHGDPIESVVFSCSGTEAVEVAFGMARLATGHRGIVGTNATYHGNSQAVIQLSRAGHDGADTPDVATFPFPERYRPIAEGLDDEALADLYLERLADAISQLHASPAGFAGMILCSILANEGLPEIPDGFMARAAALVRRKGGVVIADEVQAGYCRTGHWNGADVTGFDADIVVNGKPMGNGVPLAATSASREMVERFRAGTRYFNTFASSPLQAAAGLAVLDEIEDRGLCEQVGRVGAMLKQQLHQRLDTATWLGDVRGHGLFVGVEMVDDLGAPDASRAVDVVNGLKERGFLASNAGAFGNVLKLRPPLVFGDAEAEEFLVAFDAVVGDLDG